MNFNKFQKEQVNKKEMKAVKGGRYRIITYMDMNNDGILDRVVNVYNRDGFLIKQRW